jgi:hypothetical protein
VSRRGLCKQASPTPRHHTHFGWFAFLRLVETATCCHLLEVELVFQRMEDSVVNRAFSVQTKHFKSACRDSRQHHGEVLLLAVDQLTLRLAIPRRRSRTVPVLFNQSRMAIGFAVHL